MIRADDGCGLWAHARGAGPAVVLCHGGPGLWDMFTDLADLLAPTSTVIRWDQRGCGRSERRGPYTMAGTVADLDAIRRHFALDRMALLGHSWGADVALRYALDHPGRVTGLVYACGVGIGTGWREPFHRDFEARVDYPRWRALRDRDRTPEQDRELAILQWTADFADPATARAHAERMATPWFPVNDEWHDAVDGHAGEAVRAAECRALAVPTLILDGAQDLRPRWAVDSLADALPVVERVTLPDAGHVPWLERPEPVRAALAAFLAGLGA